MKQIIFLLLAFFITGLFAQGKIKYPQDFTAKSLRTLRTEMADSGQGISDSVLAFPQPAHTTKAPNGWYKEVVHISADSVLRKVAYWYDALTVGDWVAIDTLVTQNIGSVNEVYQNNLVFYVDYFRQNSDGNTSTSLERITSDNGTLTNIDASNFSSNGLYFNGTDERVVHTAGTWNPDSNDWVMQVAILPKDTKKDGMQFFRSHDGVDGYALMYNNGAGIDDYLGGIQWLSGAGSFSAHGQTYADTTNWQFYTFSRFYYDASNDRIRLFGNNSHTYDLISASKGESTFSTSSADIYIGNNGSSTYFEGYIGFIAVYKAPAGVRWTQDSINTYIDYNYNYFTIKKP